MMRLNGNIFLAGVLFLTLLASCVKEGDEEIVGTHGHEIVKTVMMDASIGFDDSVKPKAVLGSVNSAGKMPFLWNRGDVIKSYVGLKALSVTSSIPDEYDRSGWAPIGVSFASAEVPSEDSQDGMTFLFPGGKGDALADARGLSYTFPSYQRTAQNAFPKDANGNQLAAAVAAVSSARDVYDENIEHIDFKNVFCVVGISFDETLGHVRKVGLKGNSDEIIAGTYFIKAYTDADPVIERDDTKTVYKEAVLAYDSGAAFATGVNYYLVIAPTTFENGFSVALTLDDGTIVSKSSPSAGYVFGRSSVKDLGRQKLSAYQSEDGVGPLYFMDDANPRNVAVDGNHVYVVGAGATRLTAYSLPDGAASVMDVSTILNSSISQTFRTSDVKVIDNAGSSVVLVSNLAAGGQTLCVYKYMSLNSVPEVALEYSLPAGVRLGDKFTVEGDWNDGRLIFHDYGSKQRAYAFAINAGTISPTPTVISYGATFGGIGSVYEYSGSQWLWAGVSSSVALLDGNLATTGSTLSLPVSGTDLQAIHGVRFFSAAGVDYLAYLQVENGTSAFLKILSLGSGSTLSERIASSSLVATKSFASVGNGNACGDVAVWSDGTSAYIATVITGLGLRVYKIG